MEQTYFHRTDYWKSLFDQHKYHWTSRVPWLTNLYLPKVQDPISCQVEEEEYDEEAEEEELDDDGEWESDDYEYDEYEDWFAPWQLLSVFLRGFQRLTTHEFQGVSSDVLRWHW